MHRQSYFEYIFSHLPADGGTHIQAGADFVCGMSGGGTNKVRRVLVKWHGQDKDYATWPDKAHVCE